MKIKNNIKIISNFISNEDINYVIQCLENTKLYSFKNNGLVKIIPLRKEEKQQK
jgi:hypothetical protein